ncbi:MAG: hypothetical protein Q7J23_07965 [Nitrosomonas sp.]|nr:hypothetical protein [Nitrosomonas sp.]
MALIVVVLSHWATSKRQRVEHLIAKLEELYRLAGKVEIVDGERYALLTQTPRKKRSNGECRFPIDDFYCHRLFDELRMYVRLYFPMLEKSLEQFQERQIELNFSFSDYLHEKPLDVGLLNSRINMLGMSMRQFQQEMVTNHVILVGKSRLLRRYRRGLPLR